MECEKCVELEVRLKAASKIIRALLSSPIKEEEDIVEGLIDDCIVIIRDN